MFSYCSFLKRINKGTDETAKFLICSCVAIKIRVSRYKDHALVAMKKKEGSIFHNIFKYMIFQRRYYGVKGLDIQGLGVLVSEQLKHLVYKTNDIFSHKSLLKSHKV